MTVSREVEAEIARLYHAEHWKVGTIAAQLGVHEDVVRRVVGRLPKKTRDKAAAPATIAAYVDRSARRSIGTRSSARRACGDCPCSGKRGFGGSARALRRFVKKVRPKGEREAFLRLDPLIGEEAQIDWARCMSGRCLSMEVASGRSGSDYSECQNEGCSPEVQDRLRLKPTAVRHPRRGWLNLARGGFRRRAKTS